jgi:KDO2-lipid IV(A) lauroyltransferase
MKFKKPYYDPPEYVKTISETRDLIFNLPLDSEKEFKNSLNIISANLSLFLPHLPFSEHERFSRSAKFHQVWAAIDQDYPHLFSTSQITDKQNILEQARQGTPFIFCTFHLGSYRMMNPFLASQNIPFSLITDTNFIRNQGGEVSRLFERTHAELHKQGIKTVPVEILDAEKPQIVLQAARKIKAGTSLVFYIDGNTGVGGILHDKDKLVPLKLFGQKIYVRKGVSFISHFTKIPIVPVLCFRTGWLGRQLHFLDPIYPSADIEREVWCTSATKKLFGIFEKYLEQYPEQWEGWFYINKFVDLPSVKKKLSKNRNTEVAPPDFKARYKLNGKRFGLMDHGTKKFILHKDSFEVSDIDLNLYSILEFFSTPGSYSEVNASLGLSESQFTELVSLQLIEQFNA